MPPEEPQPPKQEEDMIAPEPAEETPTAVTVEAEKNKLTRRHRLKQWYISHKKISIPLSIIVLLLLLASIPQTRFGLAGTVYKKDFTVQVTDATARTPVSGATVSVGSVSSETNGNGKAILHLPVGPKTVTISKKYYQQNRADVTVPILKNKTTPNIMLTATGRQVKITVVNLVSKKKLANVAINLAGTNAKTDKDGNAIVVLPANEKEVQAVLFLPGFNDAKVTVKISNSSIAQNDFSLTPSGKIYFLSKLSGRIDVVKANLDGSERTTILAGTGKEDERNTVLLASRDWKYLALLARRDSDLPKLYVISTADDRLLTMDEGNASFSLVGWNNNYFVYSVHRNGYNSWQPNQQALKSYNASTGQILTLNQTAGAGGTPDDYGYESYGSVYLADNNVVFDKTWNRAYYNMAVTHGKQAGIYSINVNGSNFRTLQTFDYVDMPSYNNFVFIGSLLYKPGQIYYQVQKSGENTPVYYAYSGSKLANDSSIADDFEEYQASGNYPTYLLSPSGQQQFWKEDRDGKKVLFIGSPEAGSSQQIAVLSDFNTYGWFTDDYLLVSKNSSELYVIPKTGVKKDTEAIKITDYHKPAQTFYGYGGGYGGL